MTPLNESTIEHHAIALFRELGYTYAFGPDISPDGDHKERPDYGETLLLERLRSAMRILNPGIHPDILAEALRHAQAVAVGGLMTENALFQQMLGAGITIATQVDGEERGVIVRLLDFEHPEKNDFLVVNQYTVIHPRCQGSCRLSEMESGVGWGRKVDIRDEALLSRT